MVKFKRNDAADDSWTSFHDVVIYASLDTVARVLGPPRAGDGHKVTHEWVCEGDDGSVVTVYDYKYNGAYAKEWHVGAKNKLRCLAFKQWFEKQAKKQVKA